MNALSMGMRHDPDDLLLGSDPPRSAKLRRFPRLRDADPTPAPTVIDPARLVGLVLSVPDGVWGFTAPGRDAHPGVCVHVEGRDAFLLKGTSVKPVLPGKGVGTPWQQHLVFPSRANGLVAKTTFFLQRVRVNLRTVALLAEERALGRLEEEDLRAMQRRSRATLPLRARQRAS
ncbi:MAG: hypothetical protein JNJ88_04680 [Planctomycetes bacterium]|nr:hypothetical protein [Planctomycetota bacterium]